jgi:hypothetical protein
MCGRTGLNHDRCMAAGLRNCAGTAILYGPRACSRSGRYSAAFFFVLQNIDICTTKENIIAK